MNTEKADKNRHTIWLTNEAWNMVNRHYREDNCSFQNEYIEKAIRFYSGYLETEHADSYLPRILSDVLEGKLNALGSRVGRLLFKLTVEDAIMCNIVASDMDVDQDTMKKMRARCIKEVKETNGQINFEDALKYQKGIEA